jgi:hypothetical protein
VEYRKKGREKGSMRGGVLRDQVWQGCEAGQNESTVGCCMGIFVFIRSRVGDKSPLEGRHDRLRRLQQVRGGGGPVICGREGGVGV